MSKRPIDKTSGLKLSVRIEDERGELIPQIRNKLTNGGEPVGAHGSNSDTCSNLQQDCNASEGFEAMSHSTPPWCTCNQVYWPTYEVHGWYGGDFGNCTHNNTPEGWLEYMTCVTLFVGMEGQQLIPQEVEVHVDCFFDWSACNQHYYGGGYRGGWSGWEKDVEMQGPEKFRKGGRIRKGRR